MSLLNLWISLSLWSLTSECVSIVVEGTGQVRTESALAPGVLRTYQDHVNPLDKLHDHPATEGGGKTMAFEVSASQGAISRTHDVVKDNKQANDVASKRGFAANTVLNSSMSKSRSPHGSPDIAFVYSDNAALDHTNEASPNIAMKALMRSDQGAKSGIARTYASHAGMHVGRQTNIPLNVHLPAGGVPHHGSSGIAFKYPENSDHSQPLGMRNALAQLAVPDSTGIVYADGYHLGKDPSQVMKQYTMAPASVPAETRKKVMLMSGMFIITFAVASFYFAARMQSRTALVPKAETISGNDLLRCGNDLWTRSLEKMSSIAETISAVLYKPAVESTASESAVAEHECHNCDSRVANNNACSDRSSSPASEEVANECGTCSGFESSVAWRDASIDLNLGDRSLEDWKERRRQESMVRLGGCAIVTFFLMCLEIAAGTYLRSLALVSSGLHVFLDVAMYASLGLAVRESARKCDSKHYSYGLHRLEVVGVLFALVIQYVLLAQLSCEAAERVWSPSQELGPQNGLAISLIATMSLCVNSALAIWVGKSANIHSHSHVHGGCASRMASMHLMFDAVQNGIVILTGGILWIDPNLLRADALCTLVFVVLVVTSTQAFFRQLLGVVMQKAPDDLDCEKLFKDLQSIKDVLAVHCFHAWSISPGKIVVSAHLYINDRKHEDVLQKAQIILKHRYNIHHSTLQVSDDDDLA